MGWANCGHDGSGRPIGYAVGARCDAKGCRETIHRGLAYACGDYHGGGEWFCEGYFCERHRANVLPIDGRSCAVCDACYALARQWAIEHPDDSAELIEHFDAWEGEGWNQPTTDGISNPRLPRARRAKSPTTEPGNPGRTRRTRRPRATG